MKRNLQKNLLENTIMYSKEWGISRNPKQENQLKKDSKWKVEYNQ